MNLHRMKPKSQTVAIILNHQILVRFTESKLLFITASVSHLDQTQQTYFSKQWVILSIILCCFTKAQITNAQQNSRTTQVVCVQKKSMNNVTIYAISTNSPFHPFDHLDQEQSDYTTSSKLLIKQDRRGEKEAGCGPKSLFDKQADMVSCS